MAEVWKTIDWQPHYEVSNLGRVRNRNTGRILTTNPTKSHKHPQVWLYNDYFGETLQYTLSHIVYNAFANDKVYYSCGRKGERIGHRDGNVLNNKIENLYKY